MSKCFQANVSVTYSACLLLQNTRRLFTQPSCVFSRRYESRSSADHVQYDWEIRHHRFFRIRISVRVGDISHDAKVSVLLVLTLPAQNLLLPPGDQGLHYSLSFVFVSWQVIVIICVPNTWQRIIET